MTYLPRATRTSLRLFGIGARQIHSTTAFGYPAPRLSQEQVRQQELAETTVNNYVTGGEFNPSEMTRRLRDLRKDFTRELLQSPSGDTSDTPLHAAVRRADPIATQTLMHFDSPTIENSEGVTPYNLALQLEEACAHNAEESKAERYQEIAATIKFHSALRDTEINDIFDNNPLSMNRIFKLLLDAKDSINAFKKEAVLFIGDTQRAKSTLVNYLNGTDYRVVREGITGSSVAPVADTTTPVTRVGSGVHSETIYPFSLPLKEKPYDLVDMPGFGDTRQEVRICVDASRALLVDKLGDASVRAIVFTAMLDDLRTGGAFLQLRKSLEQVGNIITSRQAFNNLFLVITKSEITMAEEDDSSNYDQLKHEIIDNLMSLGEDLSREISSPMNNQNQVSTGQSIKLIVDHFINSPSKIVISNITETNTRTHLLDSFDRLRPISPSLLNFELYGPSANNFANIMTKFLHILNKFQKTSNETASEYKTNTSLHADKNADLASLKGQHARLEKEIETNRTTEGNTAATSIATLEDEIESLKRAIDVGNRSIARYDVKIQDTNREIDALKKDESPAEFHTLRYSENQEKTKTLSAEILRKVTEILAPKKARHLPGRVSDIMNEAHDNIDEEIIRKDDQERSIVMAEIITKNCTFTPGLWADKTFYPWPSNSKRADMYEDEKIKTGYFDTNGKFTRYSKGTSLDKLFLDNLSKGIITGRVKGDEGILGKLSVEMKLYGFKKDSTETKNKIKALNNEIEDWEEEKEQEAVIIRRREEEKRTTDAELGTLKQTPAQISEAMQKKERKLKELEIKIAPKENQVETLAIQVESSRVNHKRAKKVYEIAKNLFNLMTPIASLLGIDTNALVDNEESANIRPRAR